MSGSLAMVMRLLLIKNQDAQCTVTALIQSIFCPPVTETNKRVNRCIGMMLRRYTRSVKRRLHLFVGTVRVEPVLNHPLAACMEDVVQLQRTHSEPDKICSNTLENEDRGDAFSTLLTWMQKL